MFFGASDRCGRQSNACRLERDRALGRPEIWGCALLTVFGLFLDLVGFTFLAVDLYGTLESEAKAWKYARDVRAASFRTRHAGLAPQQNVLDEQQTAFEWELRAEEDALKDAAHRRGVRIIVGICLILVGFIFQIFGSWPPV